MRELLPQRSATVSNSANIGPSGGPRAAIWSSSTVQRVAVCRPESGKAAAPETARRARSGPRLVRALAAVWLILLGTFGNALPAQAQATTPSAPQELTAVTTAGRVDLAWSAPTDDGGFDIQRYEIRHAKGASVPNDTAWTELQLHRTYYFAGLDNGAQYSFEVRAVSVQGPGPAAPIQATPGDPPSAPQELTARASAGRVDLAWSAPTDDGGFDILRYEIRHAKGASVPNDTAWTELQLYRTYYFAGAGIDNGEQYSFEVRAVSVQGPGPAALIQATPGEPPSAPEGLSAAPGDRQAVLSWSAPENDGGFAVTGYEVRHAEGATVPANTAWTSVELVTTHTVTGLDNGELHSFEVRAVSARGGGRAAQIQATPATKPSAPQELTARASAGRIDLTWSAPADDGGFDILRYEIRGVKGASVPNHNAWWTELELHTTYFFVGLDNGEQYSLEVRAVSVQGPGPAALIQATPGEPPTAPEGLSAAPGDRQAVLSWSAPENDGGFAVTDYEVRHAEGATVPANTAWTSVGLVTTHTVTGLDNGELHSFEVRAVSARGGGRAAQIQATPATKPSAPQELTARASAGRVDLAWSAPTDDGGSDILRYEIRHAKGASVPNDTAWTELELHRTYYFAGAGIDNGEQYSFEVRAVSVQGPGPAALIQATPGEPPTAPEGLSAAPGDRQAVLSWSAPENDGGFAVTGYEVRHAEDATVPANTAWTSVGLVTTHTVTGLDNGELHSFEVRAVSARGGGRAAQIQATPATKPSAPQELTARASAGRIDLTWSAPADDGGFDILRYEIRGVKGASVPNHNAWWTELELHTTYFFVGLDNGEQYSFEVRAVSVQGPGPAALIQATPGGPPTAPEGLSAAPGDRQAVLSWSAPENEGDSAVTGYEVRHAEGATVPANTAWASVGLVTTHTVTGLDNGELHSFEVRAVSARGGGRAARIQATPATKPYAPQELTARASAGRVDLAWSAPADDGGFDILRYEIRHAKGASVPNDTAWTELQLHRTYYFAGAGIDNGEQYSFEVRAVSVQGPGPAALVQATPGGPPSAPEGLSAAPGDRQAVLSWSAPENDGGFAVTGYVVRHAEGATVPANTAWTSVGLVTTHTVTGLDNGELHSFEVRAVSARGGGRAARIQATPATKPSAPQELTARASAGRVDLTWSAPADDGGFDILRYEIRHAKGASVPNDTAWTELELYRTYYFASLDNGAQYSFEVRAVSVQDPGPAALIQATPGGPPTAPEGLSAAPGDRQAVLSWSAPENDGGFAVTDYEVRHAEGATVPANTAWTSVGLVTTHTVTGLDNGELHSFEVRAVSARGGGRAAQIQATPATKPSAPQELTASASAGRVDLAWSAPTDDGGSDILRYEIRHAKGASVPNDTAWTELELHRTYYFAGAGIDNGEQYSFEVRAVSVQGPGPAALIQATPGGPPSAPEGLSAAPGDRQAVLSWSAPKNDGGSAVTDHEVRHAEGATVPANTAWTSVGLVTTHTVTGLDNGELHSFEVRAVSARGGGRAAQIQATPATKPSAPQELTASASAGRVDLAWSAPADDGGFDILRYEIRHAKGASVPNDTAWTELELHRTYYFAGAGIDNGAQYSFEVRAVSVQGPGPAALIQATPGGPPTAPEGLSAAPGDRQAVLSWSAPENDGGFAVTDHEVRHAEGATVPANTAWTSVGLVTTHTVTGLDNGELHSFEVRAVSARGGGRAAQIQATPATKPSAPQELTASASAGRVDLAWSAPADDGGFDILRYEIRHAKGASVPNDTAWTELELHRTYYFAGAGIDNGAQYSFEVRAVSVQGPGPAALIQATPGGPPTAPEGLSAAPGDRQAVLSWSAPENDGGSAVTDYEVRHAEGATVPANTAWTSVGLVTTHTVTGLDNGEQHSFEVRAVSARGGGRAAQIQATPATKPSAPQELTASASAGRVDLAWSAPADDGGFDILRYEIRHAKGASVPNDTAWTELQLYRTYYFAGAGIDNGEQYSFEVRAVSVQGPGPAALIQATPGGPPTAPEGLSAAPGDRQAVLSWSAPKNDGGSAVTDHEVRHAEGATVPANTAWTSVGLVTTHTVTGLDNGELHSFEVRAVSARGGGRAARIQATPATKPSAPQELTARASAGRVDLTWSAPADDGGFDILRYEIRHAKGASVPNDTAWTELELYRTYYFASLDNGAQYSFEVRAVSVQDPGPAALIQATPGGPPTAPEGLSAAPGDRQAVLSWSAPENDGGFAVTDYEVRHAEGATVPANTAWTSVGLVTTHTVTGLDNGELHSFEVRAVSARGGGRAAQIQATPATKPSAPQELTASASAGRVDLAWSAPTDDGGSDILRYEIRHAKGASVPNDTAWTELELHRTYYFAGAGIDNGEQYSFEVRAVSVQGPGPAALIQATPGGPPTAPEGLSAAPGDRQAVLSWSAPENDGGSAVTDYEVRHAEGATVPANTAWTSVGLVTTHTVTGLDNGEQHSFEVRAVSARGGGRAAQIQATPATKPSAPQELTASASAGRVDLAWSAPADDGGFDILRYEIRHAKGASVPNDTAWTELQLYRTYYFAGAGIDNGEQYSFEVRAVSVQGPGPAALIQATPGGPPTAPEGLSAAPGDRQAVLSWSAPENDGGSAVTDYEVRHAEGATVPANTAWASVGLVTTHTVTGLDNGELHSFEVRAVSVQGPGPAALIQATPGGPPTAPEGLSAAPGDRQAVLSWSAPENDGGSAVTDYEVRHAEGATVPANTAWASVGLVTTHTVTGLDNGELHSFEVRAVSGVGPGATAAATATPAIEPDAPRDFTAVPGDGRVTLRWRAPANDGGSAVSHYQYRYAAGNSVPSGTPWKSVQNALTVTVDGLDNGTQYVFELRAVNAVGPSAAVTATATLLEGPAVAELQRHIAGFMLNRANALANSQPRLTRFLKDGRPASSLAGQGTEHAGAIRGSLQVQGFWLDVNGAMSNAADARSRYLFGSVGGHWRVNERLLAGVMLQLDTADETLPGQAGDIAGKGSMVGPYFAAKLEGQPLYLEGRLLYGQTENRLAHSRGVTGEFGTARWLAQLRMEGNVALDAGLALTPFADLTGARDRQRGFTDSLGRQVGGQTVSLGQAKFGVDFRLPLHVEQGNLALTGGAAGVFSSTDSGAAGAGVEAVRARLGLGLGLDYRLDDTYSFEVKGNYDGIGARDYQSFGLRGDLKIRF